MARLVHRLCCCIFAFCGVVKQSTAFAGLCRTVAVSTAQAGKHARSTSYLLSANRGKSLTKFFSEGWAAEPQRRADFGEILEGLCRRFNYPVIVSNDKLRFQSCAVGTWLDVHPARFPSFRWFCGYSGFP
jgi:hypothetical protein